jgi:peptide/nickel transport system substrate-binding protein
MPTMPPSHNPAARLSLSRVWLIGLLVCSAAVHAQPVPNLPPIRIGLSGAPKTLNPALAADAAGARLLQLTHPALLAKTPAGVPQPGLATCQTMVSGLRCTLKAGLTFADATPATAALVAQWLQQVQANPRAPAAAQLKGLSFTASSSQTMVIINNPSGTQPKQSLLQTLADVPIAHPASPTLGLGTYTLSHTDVLGTTLLTPRDATKSPLQFMVVPDATTRVLKLQRNELDAAYNDLPPELITYAQRHKLNVITAPGSGYTYVNLNHRLPLLADARVREALSLALNRGQLRQFMLGSRAAVAESLLPPGHPALWAAPEDPFNPTRAKALLQAVRNDHPDWPPFHLTLLVSTEALSQRLGQWLQASWQAIGVQVTLQPQEWGGFFAAVQQGRFDAAVLSWAGLQQPQFYHQVFHASQTPPNGLNRGAVSDAMLNTLTTAILQATSSAAVISATVATQAYVATFRPYLPLFRRNNVLLTRPGLVGCAVAPDGGYTGLTQCQRSVMTED